MRRRIRAFNQGSQEERGKPTRCRVAPDKPAPLGWRGGPRPARPAPLGMTETPTLRGSADLLDLNAAIPLGRSPPVGYGESPSMHPRPPRAPSERLGTVCSVRTVGILVAECLHAALHCPLHCPEELLVVPGWGMQLLSRTLLPISCILRKIPIQLGCLRGVCQVGIAVRAVALACREVAVGIPQPYVASWSPILW